MNISRPRRFVLPGGGYLAAKGSALASCPLIASWGGPTVDNLSVFDPASPPADSIRDLFFLVLAVTGVIFLLVQGVLFYCVFRFRRKAEPDPVEPPQIYGSQPIEVAWTVAPLLVVFVLFLVVVRTVVEVRSQPLAETALHVTAIGHQWWWEYAYYEVNAAGERELLFRTANELRIPTDRPVALELQSADVIHSYWVPRLAGKTDMVPGKVNRLWFKTSEPGVYHGQCAEYCGTQHANMLLRVIAETPEDFAFWRENEREPTADEPKAEAGKNFFFSLSCVNCHTVRGTTAAGTFGPDLTHLMSRQTLAARTIPNDRENLIKWVNDPHELKPGCNMPSLHLSRSQVEEVVAYLLTLQ
jgi:cytochrome c oxidase subunit 2